MFWAILPSLVHFFCFLAHCFSNYIIIHWKLNCCAGRIISWLLFKQYFCQMFMNLLVNAFLSRKMLIKMSLSNLTVFYTFPVVDQVFFILWTRNGALFHNVLITCYKLGDSLCSSVFELHFWTLTIAWLYALLIILSFAKERWVCSSFGCV